MTVSVGRSGFDAKHSWQEGSPSSACMVVTVLPALLVGGWFPTETMGDIALIIGVFLGVGLCLWLLR